MYEIEPLAVQSGPGQGIIALSGSVIAFQPMCGTRSRLVRFQFQLRRAAPGPAVRRRPPRTTRTAIACPGRCRAPAAPGLRIVRRPGRVTRQHFHGAAGCTRHRAESHVGGADGCPRRAVNTVPRPGAARHAAPRKCWRRRCRPPQRVIRALPWCWAVGVSPAWPARGAVRAGALEQALDHVVGVFTGDLQVDARHRRDWLERVKKKCRTISVDSSRRPVSRGKSALEHHGRGGPTGRWRPVPATRPWATVKP